MTENKSKTACVIIIGNEILSGRTQDVNLSFLGERLAGLGINLLEARVISDEEEDIIETINHCRLRYDYIFTTGGIGPTHDDITTESIAKAFGVVVKRNAEAVACMERYYEPGKLTEARLKMADIPEGARLIDNPVSGAPGIQLDNVFILAGVPTIMQAMFESLTDRLIGGPPILTASISTNLTESMLAEGMGKIQDECPDVSIGSYPYFKRGKLGVNIVLRSIDKSLLFKQLQLIETLIEEIGGKTLEIRKPD